MYLTDPVINIDSQFQKIKKCGWLPTGWIVGDVVQSDYLGGLHVNGIFRKQLFQLQLNDLGQAHASMVEQIFNNLTTILHTVEVITPSMRRIWDGTTSASNGTNTDINRVRNKVYMTKFNMTSYDGNPNRYQIIIDCQES